MAVIERVEVWRQMCDEKRPCLIAGGLTVAEAIRIMDSFRRRLNTGPYAFTGEVCCELVLTDPRGRVIGSYWIDHLPYRRGDNGRPVTLSA